MNPEENTQVVDEVLTEESLIEEVSIDGMCGVY
ncbi:mycofactocin precursor MftA [Nocardioides sp. NPDC000445]